MWNQVFEGEVMLRTHRVLHLGSVGSKVQGERLGVEMRLRVGRNERVTKVSQGKGRLARNQGLGSGGYQGLGRMARNQGLGRGGRGR